MVPNLQIFVSIHIFSVSSHLTLTFDLSRFLYLSLIYIFFKSLSSLFTHPDHLNDPLTVFVFIFISIPSFGSSVFSLSIFYFTLLLVLALLPASLHFSSTGLFFHFYLPLHLFFISLFSTLLLLYHPFLHLSCFLFHLLLLYFSQFRH